MATFDELLSQLKEEHDFRHGQTYSHGGTSYSSTSVCRLCSLEYHYTSDDQNGDYGTYTWKDGETEKEISFRQALKRGCLTNGDGEED